MLVHVQFEDNGDEHFSENILRLPRHVDEEMQFWVLQIGKHRRKAKILVHRAVIVSDKGIRVHVFLNRTAHSPQKILELDKTAHTRRGGASKNAVFFARGDDG